MAGRRARNRAPVCGGAAGAQSCARVRAGGGGAGRAGGSATERFSPLLSWSSFGRPSNLFASARVARASALFFFFLVRPVVSFPARLFPSPSGCPSGCPVVRPVVRPVWSSKKKQWELNSVTSWFAATTAAQTKGNLTEFTPAILSGGLGGTTACCRTGPLC